MGTVCVAHNDQVHSLQSFTMQLEVGLVPRPFEGENGLGTRLGLQYWTRALVSALRIRVTDLSGLSPGNLQAAIFA